MYALFPNIICMRFDTILKVFSSKYWNFNETLAGRKSIYQQHSSAIQGLRDITPNSGTYASEADVHEPNYTSKSPSLLPLCSLIPS